jgi:hypothetical protein
MHTISGGSPAIPFDVAPSGTQLACNIVIGRRADGTCALEQRLPSGVPFDANDPVHAFGLFVVQNAQQLMGLAMQASAEARAVQQTNEIIAAASLQGA